MLLEEVFHIIDYLSSKEEKHVLEVSKCDSQRFLILGSPPECCGLLSSAQATSPSHDADAAHG